MSKIPVIAIFDVGKTNKKIVLFDERYRLVREESMFLNEITDEDGFPCEDVHALAQWVRDKYSQLLSDPEFDVRAVNFSAYGASFVYLNDALEVMPPLYNYLKPCSRELQKQFYANYGGEDQLARQTASPVLGNLNSGMQLYGLKYEKPVQFARMKYALHLPQFLSFILSGKIYSDITSIGCHTHLWDFENNDYHPWVKAEGIQVKLAPLAEGKTIERISGEKIHAGIGLHDSSAALIPYMSTFDQPFILLSTGTWCISLNPFNNDPLSNDELHQDCLCYLSYLGRPVKASRLFAGHAHEEQVKRLAEHFNQSTEYFQGISFDAGHLIQKDLRFASQHLSDYSTCDEAYHGLMADIVQQQVKSTQLVSKEASPSRIFVDGGFSKNQVYMNLLAVALPDTLVYAATMAQASSIGAAMAIHDSWNNQPMPEEIIELKLYRANNF